MRRDLSGKLRLLDIWFHDFVSRKRLVVGGEIVFYRNYPLMRVKLVYREKRRVFSKNVIVYPCDVIPYVRKTLDVIEEMARVKLVEDLSYKDAGDVFFERYGFGLNSIKSALRVTETAFNRLVTCELAEGLDVRVWLKGEVQSFAQLNYLYWARSLEMDMGPLSLFR